MGDILDMTALSAVKAYVDGKFLPLSGGRMTGNLILGSGASGETQVGVNLKMGVQNDAYGLMPYANNWNSIGASNLYWFRVYSTNIYATNIYEGGTADANKLPNKYQTKLTAQTAYSAKGSATKVPQITTNALGQVTSITEVDIAGGTIPATTTANKVLLSTTTSGTVTWSNWSTAGLLKTDTSGRVSVDTNSYLPLSGGTLSGDLYLGWNGLFIGSEDSVDSYLVRNSSGLFLSSGSSFYIDAVGDIYLRPGTNCLLYYNSSEVASHSWVSSNYLAKPTAITAATKCKITYNANGLVTAGADLAASDIPALAASKITSGTFDAARIPSLAASKITSGTFDIARIPTGTTSTTVALGNHTHSQYAPLVPATTNTTDLGSSSKTYRDLYARGLKASGSITIDADESRITLVTDDDDIYLEADYIDISTSSSRHVKLDADNLTSGTTRYISFPDKDGTLGMAIEIVDLTAA